VSSGAIYAGYVLVMFWKLELLRKY